MQITITSNENPKPKPDQDKLSFGIHFSDHMFNMDYHPDKGWHDPRIEPTAPWFSIRPPWCCIMDKAFSKA